MDPMFFYYFKNILHTYMLPITVPIMFLIIGGGFHKQKSTLCIGLIFPAVVFVAYFAVLLQENRFLHEL
jgi:hypothetical protein